MQEAEALGLKHPDWFFPDGLVGDEAAWLTAPVKVLYILKEGNLRKPPKDFGFWFKRIAADDTKHIIKKRIRLMQQVITSSDNLSVTAYMNLNKNGGRSKTDNRLLKAYATHSAIAPLIKEQIEILAPHVIVCCGCYVMVWHILGEMVPYRVVGTWHPSCWGSHEKYREKFLEKWEGIR